jgi:MoaA/NifB/PqqE/SkfB family radical SAM enzyme
MSTDDVLDILNLLKAHNKDMFHIFYGGEPFLRKDLPDIISHCNLNDIHYTIISNNTPKIVPYIDKLLDEVGHIKGLTASVDPFMKFRSDMKLDDRMKKTKLGLKNLLRYRDKIKDLVAEITVMKENVDHLYDLVRRLTDLGICSDITFIDIAKSEYYDFSNVTNTGALVNQSTNLRKQFDKILDDDTLNIHMKEYLIPKLWGILPSNMDCEIDDDLHNISIDADGSLRLCLRIKGRTVPNALGFSNLFTVRDFEVTPYAKVCYRRDKIDLCRLCNHTCMLMSRIEDVDGLVHTNIREER